ncbi:MAG: hypothetical protein WCL02_01665 [bacterium]
MKTKEEKLAEFQKKFEKFKKKSLWIMLIITIISVSIVLLYTTHFYDTVSVIVHTMCNLIILGMSILLTVDIHGIIINIIAYRKSNRLDKKIENAQQNTISGSMKEEIENMEVLRCMYRRHNYYHDRCHSVPEPPNYREFMCSL